MARIIDTNFHSLMDWWTERTNAQRNWAANSYLMAQNHHANLIETKADPEAIEKAVWIMNEARAKAILEDKYVMKQTMSQSKQHLYWLFTAGILLILGSTWAVCSVVLWMVPFSSHMVGFILRQLVPFFLAWILLAAFITIVVQYPKWNRRRHFKTHHN